MQVNGKHYRAVWMKNGTVYAIDQTKLPFRFDVFESGDYKTTSNIINSMLIRGAGTIGAVAGYAMAQASKNAPKKDYESYIYNARTLIESTRPTAQDLWQAVERVYKAALSSREKAVKTAHLIADEYVRAAIKIGEEGEKLIENETRILTHCNAGWLALVDYGSALSPLFLANKNGKNIFVYVDETRPRNQGALLTAFELSNEGIAHSVITDNAAAFYMAEKKVDMVITGADRIAANGDVANKIGTLEKAIAARYFDIPFYVAAPLSTFDTASASGKEIPIEHRSEMEVRKVRGIDDDGEFMRVETVNPNSQVSNPAFDITPSKLISGIITEKGIIKANSSEISVLQED